MIDDYSQRDLELTSNHGRGHLRATPAFCPPAPGLDPKATNTQASGLSQSAIGNYESGQRFTSRALLRLAHALGVSPEWLEFGHAPAAYPATTHALQEGPAAEPWPFEAVSYRDYAALNRRDKAVLEQTVQAYVRACHDTYRQGGKPASSGKRAKKSS